MRQMASNLTANDDDGVSKGLTLTFLLIAIGIILPIYQVLQAQKKNELRVLQANSSLHTQSLSSTHSKNHVT